RDQSASNPLEAKIAPGVRMTGEVNEGRSQAGPLAGALVGKRLRADPSTPPATPPSTEVSKPKAAPSSAASQETLAGGLGAARAGGSSDQASVHQGCPRQLPHCPA